MTGATSGGDDETETDETPENQHSIGSMLPRYIKINYIHGKCRT